jgi:threonine synthase
VAGIWRHAALLPDVAPHHRITLGEPVTPLVEAFGVRYKLDSLMPTGSFKDRGSAVAVGCALEAGVTSAIADSSGNAGASLAAYCARAGLALELFVPAETSPAKLAQAQAYGATVIPVAGGRAAAADAARRHAASTGAFHLRHGSSDAFLAGTRTAAFELWEQLDGATPPAVVVPVGAGTLLLGLARGFATLEEAGLVDRIPRLYGVQAERFAPLARAYRGQPVGELQPTIAEGICVADPPRGAEILDAVRRSGGDLLTVAEEAIESARDELARGGLYVEPTAAVAHAALPSVPGPRERVVVMVTGSGLKQPMRAVGSRR